MEKVDSYIASLPDWQRANLEFFRAVIHEVDPEIVEDFKWNVPVFLHNGKMYFAMSAFKAHTKFNFIGNGALLKDKNKLFNNGFDSKKSRAIDLRERENVSEDGLKALIAESVAN